MSPANILVTCQFLVLIPFNSTVIAQTDLSKPIEQTRASKKVEAGISEDHRTRTLNRILSQDLNRYAKKNGAKAAAFALGKNSYIVTVSTGQYAWPTAIGKALKKCHLLERKSTYISPCRILKIGSQQVDDWSSEQIKHHVKQIKELTSFELYLEKYKTLKSKKALALTVGKMGKYQAFYRTSKVSLARAREKALSSCTKKVHKRKLKLPPCQIYFENDQSVQPLPPNR